jgi:hypothetical protein
MQCILSQLFKLIKAQKQDRARAHQAGGVFANPLLSSLADEFSKTQRHSLRKCPFFRPRLSTLGPRNHFPRLFPIQHFVFEPF